MSEASNTFSVFSLITQLGLSGIFLYMIFEIRKDVKKKDEIIQNGNEKLVELTEKSTKAIENNNNALNNNTEAVKENTTMSREVYKVLITRK